MNTVSVSPQYGMPANISSYVGNINPLLLLVIALIIIVYYIVFSSLNRQNVNAYTPSFSYIEVTLWGMFLFLLMINGLQMFLSIDVKAVLTDLFYGTPKVDIQVKVPTKRKPIKPVKKEVFHIPENIYTYDDAKLLCKAYNADIASYEQIKEAHEKEQEY